MAAVPLLEEVASGPAGSILSSLASVSGEPVDPQSSEAMQGRGPRAGVTRSLAIYPASAGFDLVEELEHLCARSVEPNIFFNPRFLAPAMPRLEDKEIRLAVIRDVEEHRSRLRLLVPFSIEKAPVPFGVPIMRTWSNPFGPLGTPLVDHDDPEGVIADFFSLLARPRLKLPRVFAFPETRLDGPFAAILGQFAASNNLTVAVTGRAERPYLQSSLDGDDYLRKSLSAHHFRGFGRLKRRLAELGTVEHVVARNPAEIRLGLESFLSLEVSGWKGREGSAMAIDRYRAAFAREAVDRLSARDLVRVHMLKLDGVPIACVIVFVEGGTAYTWKTAYDEAYAQWSPGTLLMLEVTRSHLDDPNILGTDSCAVPDHPVMSRIWSERRPVGTLVVGLTADSDRLARQAASQLHLYRETRNLARIWRERLKKLIGR